ncbi:MAG: hypothetical protein ACK48G_09495 [Chitinophagaceae bacterium]|jgi:hypothetical protein
MKQIKVLLLLVCGIVVGSVKAQVDRTYDYIATYTWTGGGANASWTSAANWSVVHNAPVTVTVPVFPNVVEVAGLTQQHNVVIPSGTPRVPQLAGPLTINISNLSIAAGAQLNLSGRTLVIHGSLSGTGEFVGGPNGVNPSNLSIDGLQQVTLYSNRSGGASMFGEHNAMFNGSAYFNNFNAGPFGDIDLVAGPATPFGTPLGPINGFNFVPQVFGAVSYSFNAAAAPGGTYVYQKAPIAGVTNDSSSTQLSTRTELDELVITFTGAPVYAVSADFSITDADFTPMTLGKIVEFNAGQLTPTITNDCDIVVTLQDGSIFHYSANASGEFVGFVSQQPITSITVASGVFISNIQNVGFGTIDNLKFGTRVPTGTVYMSQSTATSNQLGNLSVNVANAASLVGSVEIGSPMSVTGIVTPTSGVLNSTPAATPTAANLKLISNATATASIANHTNSGTITGSVEVQRFIAAARTKQWRFLGLPYSSSTQVQNITGINKVVSATARSMMTFNEALNDGLYGNTGIKNAGYATLGNPLGNILSLQGFAAWIYDLSGTGYASGTLATSQTMITSGTLLETGADVVKAVVVGDQTGNSNPLNQGWNLIANPYASTIDYDLVGKTNVDATIYRWDPQLGAWAGYNSATGVATGDADNYIESGSSFFVKATTSPTNLVGGSLTFGQASKVLATNSFLNQFKKNSGSLGISQQSVGSTGSATRTKPSGLRIKASVPTDLKPMDVFVGLSINDATPGFDSRYDAYNLGRSGGAAVAINGNDKISYAMQFDRPIAEPGKEKRYYPLTVSVPAVGAAKLELELEGTWNSLNKVYLIDKKGGKTIPLTGNKLSYDFNMNATSEEDRFVLAINHMSASEKAGISTVDVRVMNNPVQNDVVDALITHPSAKPKSFSIVNGTGATLNKGAIPDDNSLQHRLNFGKSNANGVFYLKVDFENGDSKTVKFIKL